MTVAAVAATTTTDSCIKFNDSQLLLLFCAIWISERLSSCDTCAAWTIANGMVCLVSSSFSRNSTQIKLNRADGYFHRAFVANSGDRAERALTISASEQNMRDTFTANGIINKIIRMFF